MFNPFSLLSKSLLDAFVRAGKKYFVRQTFNRANGHFDNGIKGYFIFTHHSEIGHAQHHLGAIREDSTAYLYNWDYHEDQRKLIVAASQPAGYKLYSVIFEKDWEKQLTMQLKAQVKKYIDHKLDWKPARGETVDFNIYVTYGELYAKLKLRAQEVRIKLEDIENFK